MASTFDNDLRLEEMATGENAGSWGTKTNTNLELIADAFGYGTFTIADADTTLEMPEGSGADNALRSLYLKISSSADLTTTRTLTLAPNTVSKLWYIENNTSGGQTITISQGSGANVSILNGQAKLVATDGAGAGAAVIDVTQDLAIPDLFIDDDLSLQSDGAIINFGEDADVTLTHVADTGLRLNAAMALEFRDGDLSINSSADGQLDIDADTEIEIVAPTVDIDASTAMTIDTTTLTVTGNTVLDGDLTVDTDTLYVDSTNDRVGINNTSPDGLLSLGDTSSTSAILNFKTTKSTFAITPSNTDGGGTTLETSFVAGGHGPMIFRTSGAESMRLSAGAVFNNGSADQDFTVKTPSYSQALFVDGGNNTVNIRNANTNANNSMNISGDIRLGAESATRGDVIRSAGGASSSYNGIVIMSNHVDSADQANDTLPSWLLDVGGSWADGTNFPPSTSDHVTIARRAPGGSKYSSTKYVSIGNAGTIFNIDNADSDFTVESVGSSHMLHVDAANSRVGINDNTPERAFSVVGGSDFFLAGNNTNGGTIRLGSNRSNNTTQYGVINMQQYNNTNEPEGYLLLGGTAADGLNYLNIGGGVDEQNMATVIRMFTGPDTTTRSSSTNGIRMLLDYQTVYFNSNGEAVDFRYDSDTVGKALFYDSSENTMEIGGSSSGTAGSARLKVVSPSIGASVNDRLKLQQWYYGTGNGSFFTLKARREAANGVWTGVVTDFVLEVDNSDDIYTYQTFGIGSVRFNDLGSGDVDFMVRTDTVNKLFIDASSDLMQVVLGGTTSNGVQFTDGSNERMNIFYNGGQKVTIKGSSAPGGNDEDTLSLASYTNNNSRDIIAISRNGAIYESAGSANSPNNSTGSYRQNKRYYTVSTNFNNPTLTLCTITASLTYPQAVFKVTVWNHGTSANATGYSVGYVTLECDTPYTSWQKSEQAFAFEFNTYGSALPTWNITTASPSANQATIAITCNRFTNYDGFYVEIEALRGNGMDIDWAAS